MNPCKNTDEKPLQWKDNFGDGNTDIVAECDRPQAASIGHLPRQPLVVNPRA